MKHIKNIEIFERRNLKDYKKYNDIIKKKFEKYVKIEKISVYTETDFTNSLTIEFKTWYGIKNIFFEYVASEIGKVDYDIDPANGNQLIVILKHVPESYLLKLDAELYNI